MGACFPWVFCSTVLAADIRVITSDFADSGPYLVSHVHDPRITDVWMHTDNVTREFFFPSALTCFVENLQVVCGDENNTQTCGLFFNLEPVPAHAKNVILRHTVVFPTDTPGMFSGIVDGLNVTIGNGCGGQGRCFSGEVVNIAPQILCKSLTGEKMDCRFSTQYSNYVRPIDVTITCIPLKHVPCAATIKIWQLF